MIKKKRNHKPLYDEQNRKDLVLIECEKRGWEFLGWVGEYKGYNTKLTLSNEYGVWNTTSLNNFLHRKQGCPFSKGEKISEKNKLPDEVIIKNFFSTGRYCDGTIFKREVYPYWSVYCPICKTKGKAVHCDLMRGQKCCSCNKHRQEYAYINLITQKEIVLAIKYGICVYHKRRIKEQQVGCIYKVSNYSLWKFPNSDSCKTAEREIKNIFAPLLKYEEMKDGYTETTYFTNVERIEKIYETHGGIKQK